MLKAETILGFLGPQGAQTLICLSSNVAPSEEP